MLRYACGTWVAAAALVVACSSSNTNGPPGGSSGSSSGGGTTNGHTGEQLVKDDYGCVTCHGDDMAGQTTPITIKNELPCHQLYPPNLTPDKTTGVGNWTDAQLQNAIVNGVDNNSMSLCPEMNHYKDAPAADVTAIIQYLRSIPAVSKTIPTSICPPLKGTCS